MDYYSENSANGGITLTNVTGKTDDISEYLDSGFYGKFWYKDNAGLFNSKPGRWLGISHQTGRFMCYQILTKTGKVISIFTVHQVNNIELSNDEVK